MRNSTKKRILRRLRSKGRGIVFVTKDVIDLGNRDAVDQALSRLATDGTIRRIAHGVYDFPKIHKRLGPLTPDPDSVARALARKNGCRLQVSGARAANFLGLSTQVPAKTVYLTDGPTRSVRVLVGNQVIQFQHRSPRCFAGAGKASGTVLQALRYLGPGGVTKQVVDKLRDSLSQQDRDGLRDLLPLAPIWAQAAIHQISEQTTAGGEHSWTA